MGEQLENIFIGAYLGAVKTGASTGTSLGAFVAEAAAQILGIECEHRVLIRDIAGQDPPNNRFYEGDVAAPPSNALGDTGQRSTVYPSGDAVNALLALGITPSDYLAAGARGTRRKPRPPQTPSVQIVYLLGQKEPSTARPRRWRSSSLRKWTTPSARRVRKLGLP